MSLDQVQQLALQTYNENLEFFKQNHPDLYKTLELYATAIELGQVKPEFELQYLNTHFDIVNPTTKEFLYTQNSNEISQKIADDISYDATVNSFKTYYELSYNDKMAKRALEQDILASYSIGNAPVINFVNKNVSNPQNVKEFHKFIIFGVLLGIHIPLIHEKLNSDVYLIVEPNLEFFRLSLFVTNYANLATKTKLYFSIAQNEYEFRKTFDSFYGEIFIYNHYLKFVNISSGSDMYMKVIQNYLVSQAHLLYSYDRTFLSISRTNSYITQNFKLLNVKYKQSLKPFEKPILFLAAGPSLQHNINFVKENQDKFTIVAIYATLPILEKNGIKPDIVTQYDEQDIQVLNTLDKLNDINYFKDTIFIFASHVNAKLMNSFPKENIFIFQAMFEVKENFGILTSPSIGELTYALLLLFQTKELYLLGLDFAMDVESGATHIEGHSGAGAFNKIKELEDSSDKNYSFRKNTIIVKGNFLPEVKSIPVFKTNIDTFAQFTEFYKDESQKVYNLSNGAYLSGAVPLRIEDIDFSTFPKKDQESYKNEIFKALEGISEIGYNEKDLEKINLKLSGVKKMKKHLEQFQKIKKYNNFDEYQNTLINVVQSVLFEKQHCEDLQSILLNYSSHNLHYIFYLFDLDSENDKKKYIYEINKNLLTQLNKIIDTYVISISYSSDENSILLKKLNKYLKEYSIKNSIYSEPFFKELVETSKRGYQYDFKPNSIGFFAIEDNLTNKDFVNYVKEVLKRFPEVELKLFYFFEFQKIQAQFVFKQELNRIELSIPNNISNITSSVELWLETYDNTINVKRIDDIILNNYENIYGVMFDNKEKALKELETELIVPKKFTLANNLKENFTLSNTSYFEFANSLKEDIDKDLFNEKYLKEHIGFFAIKENLQQEFVNKIVEISNKFPNIKFSAFYFDEEVLKEYISIFSPVINRFKLICPKNIYEIADNTEVWVQAKIPNQSFLFDKIYKLINDSVYLYPLVLNEDFIIQEDSSNYLDNLVENYDETIFVKQLNRNLNIERLQNTMPENNIAFLATNDNIYDDEFIRYLLSLKKAHPSVSINAYYFNDSDSTLVKEKLHNTNFSILKFTKDNFFNNLKIFINNKNSIFYQDIEQKMLPFNKNIYYSIYDRALSTRKLSDFVLDKDNFFLNSLKEIGIDPNIFKKFNNNYHIILTNYFLEENSNNLQIGNNTTLAHIVHYIYIEFALQNNSFIQKINKLRKLHLPGLFKSSGE
ncbi:6-hydroxymethylpterin diphosphokinase MptE-like protein [Arcobacter sp. F2176]|uniref:motility associated factor glycosyltransferase family protein n=1 Tax=Arcobacter sp. F2176 TaxID=2044511 RepID=UPI00100A5354|nr:6-hydroxymethylpterin diphosphokinase MptE-like protein [Arcobacter sp. F2176]RXJ82216.1 hypothetical protein CRU95_01800 [Arcobacter sp. F2176]